MKSVMLTKGYIMAIRCFVSSFVNFAPIGGDTRYIASVVDQHFSISDSKLVARGYSSLRANLGENYTKDIIIEVSYSEDTKKFIVNVFWQSDWLDWKGMPITRYAREKASGVCSLDKAEETAIRAFQKEANEMLENLIYLYGPELKQVFKI